LSIRLENIIYHKITKISTKLIVAIQAQKHNGKETFPSDR